MANSDQRPVSILDGIDREAVGKLIPFIATQLECMEAGIGSVTTVEGAQLDLTELGELRERFDANIKLLESSDNADMEQTNKLQVNFSLTYRRIRERLLTIVGTKKRKFESNECSDLPLIKLPAIDIPKFSGDISKWAAFKTMFLNLVDDERIRRNDAARRHYLYQALTGDALSIVENLRDTKFQTCWDLLVQTYDDPFRRAQAHYNGLFHPRHGLSLRQRLIASRQHSEGLRTAHTELGLNSFEQIVIWSFLESSETRPALRLAWERRVTELKEKASLAEFYKFVDQESQSSDRAFQPRPKFMPKRTVGHTAMAAKTSFKRQCEKCGEVHFLNQCSEFRALPVSERATFVKSRQLCAVCFRRSCSGAKKHAAACPMKNLFCKICKKPHNTLLHINGESNLNYLSEVSRPLEPKNTQHSLCLFNNRVTRHNEPSKNYEPFLATAVIRIHRQRVTNSALDARAFLDNGSQFNFITNRLVQRLGIATSHTNVSVHGIGPGTAHIQQSAEIKISSRYTEFTLKIQCLIVEHIITSMIPHQYLNVDSWNISPRLHLADPYFNIPAEIDLLLGLDVFWQVLQDKKLNLRSGLPKLQETKFGWIIAGSMRTEKTISGTSVFFVQPSNNELLDQMKKFWVIENCDTKPVNNDDVECERLFSKSTYRQDDGRFVVSLPFKQDPSNLGESRTSAIKQFYHLERRLQHNDEMRKNYNSCMDEYRKLGHMRKIEETSVVPNFYLPHHAVVNPSSTSTKQRTVFNASAKTTSGVSLNDILYTGPVVQPELIAILIRFRLHSYVMSADIEKMYRQIRIHPDHAVFQRIFWRDSPSKPLDVYELNTLSFGERPAPYLATRCLNELALRYSDAYPNAKSVILNDFYVDNLLTGSNSLDQAIRTQEHVISLLNSAGFPLSKWCANVPQLIANIDPKHIETKFSFTFDQTEMIKTLGMYWVPSDDSFKIWFNRPDVAESRTKRQILSVIASIFDPMGLIGPVTVTAKCFMQEIWKLTVEPIENSSDSSTGVEQKTANQVSKKVKKVRIHWDDVVSNEILEPWRKFAENLRYLNQISLPRHIIPSNSHTVFELHGFADASSRAYGAVIYSRVIDASRNCRVSLLCSKSRVAPLKQLSIARLELCAATLLAELVEKITSILSVGVNIDRIRLWSDSKVTLSWIAAPSYRWNVFVAHRVSKIQTITENYLWDYVESASNPADTLSRGLDPREVTADHEWFIGPSWLRRSADPWTDTIVFSPNVQETEERKKVKPVVMPVVHKVDLFKLVGLPNTGIKSVERVYKKGYAKLRKLTAWIARYRLNIQPYFPRAKGSLNSYEFDYAETMLVKLSQLEYFSDEITKLQNNEPLHANSTIKTLNPFLDRNGVLRVGGRLGQTELPYERRHPILLHPSHKLSDLIIFHEHLAHLHAGPKLLNSVLRRKYWILRINGAISRCLKNCVTCVRFAARTRQTIMAELPKARVTPSKPFTHCGIDFAGPFKIIGKGGKHKVELKAYIAIFICFATKGIHLELVSDLTTPTFLASLSRFVRFRGSSPAHIYSDNGTTFVGANRTLTELNQFMSQNWPKLEEFAQIKGFQWHFIPPRAPHFGGIWEAGVKSVKKHLYRVADTRTLNFEQFQTLLADIEACLNSRPITSESANPDDDLEALTPGHFLTGGPITALPSANYLEIPDNRLTQWQAVQKMTQQFWKRWTTEYLNTLQQRYKWHLTKGEVQINDLVLVKENDVPPTQWKRGRIVELHAGKDGEIRVVTLRTSVGTVKRPVGKLIFLPKEILYL